MQPNKNVLTCSFNSASLSKIAIDQTVSCGNLLSNVF